MAEKVAKTVNTRKTGWEEEWIRGLEESYSAQQYAERLGVEVSVIYTTTHYLRKCGLTSKLGSRAGRGADWAGILASTRKPEGNGRQLVDEDGQVRPKAKRGGAKK